MSIKKIFTGTFLSLLISLILVCILAVVVYFSNISDRATSGIIFAISCLSVFLGALVLAKNIESRGLLNGLVLGGVYFLILLVVSLLANGTVSLSFSNILRLLSILASGSLGGILGINTKKERAMV